MNTGQHNKRLKKAGNNKFKKMQSGSATVEAAIVLPLTIFAFISILSIVRIITTYSRMQHALNQIAIELSQYSYIYAVSGLKQQHDQFLDDINNAKEKIQSQTEAIVTFYKAVESLTGDVSSVGEDGGNVIENLLHTVQEFENIQDSSAELMETVNEILKDPMQEVQLIGLALSDSLISKTKTALFGAITNNMLKNNLSEDLKVDAKQLGKHLLIKGGMERLDFSSSTFFNDGQTIDIIVEYTVKPGIFIIPEIRLRNRVSLLAWTWGVDRALPPDSIFENESVWNLEKEKSSASQHLARGKKIDKLFASELKNKIDGHAEITPDNFKTIDLIEYAHNGKDGSLVMIFSLNPFLPGYSSKSAVVGTIKQNLNKLSTFQKYETKDFIIDLSLLSGNYKRVAYIVVPENEMLPEPYVQAFEECRKLAEKMDIELFQVKKYGEYDYYEGNE